MIRIEEVGHRLYLTFSHVGEREGVVGLLSCKHPAAHHMRKRVQRLKKWKGMIEFIHGVEPGNPNYKWAPAGFARRIREFLDHHHLEYEWVEKHDGEFAKPEFQQRTAFTLDKDQIPACRALLQERQCSIEFETGSGKTLVCANAIACLEAEVPNMRTLVIVPKLTLLYQTQKAFTEYLGDQIGIVGDGKWEWDYPIVIATADTACGSERLKHSEEIKRWLKTIHLLVTDESHHASSDRWQDLIAQCDPPRLWAVSAKLTYEAAGQRHKEMALEGVFGRPVHSGQSEERSCPVEVIAYKHLSWVGKFENENLVGQLVDGTPTLYRLPPDPEWHQGMWRGPNEEGRVPPWMLIQIDGKWKPDKKLYGIYANEEARQKEEVERENLIYWTKHDVAIMEFAERNQWAVQLGLQIARRREQFVVTVRRAKHLRRILRLFAKAGLAMGELHGGLTGKQQSAMLEALRNDKIPGIVAIHSTVGEGVDLPDLRHIIKLDGVSDEQVLHQLKGRLQRAFPGKVKGTLHISRDPQVKSLDRSVGSMLQYYRNKGLKVRVVEVSNVQSEFALD